MLQLLAKQTTGTPRQMPTPLLLPLPSNAHDLPAPARLNPLSPTLLMRSVDLQHLITDTRVRSPTREPFLPRLQLLPLRFLRRRHLRIPRTFHLALLSLSTTLLSSHPLPKRPHRSTRTRLICHTPIPEIRRPNTNPQGIHTLNRGHTLSGPPATPHLCRLSVLSRQRASCNQRVNSAPQIPTPITNLRPSLQRHGLKRPQQVWYLPFRLSRPCPAAVNTSTICPAAWFHTRVTR